MESAAEAACVSTPEAATIVAAPVEPSAPIAAVPAPGWVEPKAERAPVGAEADEGVVEHIRIPVPAGIEAGHSGILAGDLVVGLSQVLGAETAPVIELVLG